MQTVFKAITATIKGFVWHYQLKLDNGVFEITFKSGFLGLRFRASSKG